MRSIFKGSLNFGLINIPIKIGSAIREQEIKFNMLCSCGNKIKQKKICDKCNKEVPFEDIKKGYQIGKDKYLMFDKNEIEQLKVKSNKIIEIEKFISSAEFDFLHIDKNYYMFPDVAGIKAYSLLREALSVVGKVAIGKITLRSKEKPCLISAYKNCFILSLLFYPDEIVKIDDIPQQTIKENELKLAEQLIEKSSGSFDLTGLKDTYKEILQNYIMAKMEGKTPQIAEIMEAKTTDNLEEALKQSLEMVM